MSEPRRAPPRGLSLLATNLAARPLPAASPSCSFFDFEKLAEVATVVTRNLNKVLHVGVSTAGGDVVVAAALLLPPPESCLV